MYHVGGTAIGLDSYEALPPVQAPYLPPLTKEEEKTRFTLVLDLDETLVHYFEVGPL